MRLTLKLCADNQEQTVRLGERLVDQTRGAVAGLHDGRISYEDAYELIVSAASSGFQGAALSKDELAFLDFLAGPSASKRIRIVSTGEELPVRVTQGKRSGASALARDSAPWNAAKTLILKGVEDRAYAEFGHGQGETVKVTAHRVTIETPEQLETMINDLMAEEAKLVQRRRPLVWEPARVKHDATTSYTGSLLTTPNHHLAWAPRPDTDDRGRFPGSQTEAQLARAIAVLGGNDWKITNYSVTDGDETSELGAVIYSAEQGLAVRFGYWSTH